MALAPVPMDCASPLPWRDTFCPGEIEGDDIRRLANEHDIMQFLWTVYANAPALDFQGIAGLMRATCNRAPCDDATDLSTCGPQCDLRDRDLRWAPILPEERDGIDDPNDPNDEDIPATVVSLSTGAGIHLGEGTPEVDAFRTSAMEHGITPGPLP